MSQYFYFLQKHDPSGQPTKLTFQLLPDDGIEISNATVTVVDRNDDPIVGTDLIITDVSVGVITGNLWGVSFYVSGGTAGKIYLLRCRYTTTASPTEGSDRTMRLRVDNT